MNWLCIPVRRGTRDWPRRRNVRPRTRAVFPCCAYRTERASMSTYRIGAVVEGDRVGFSNNKSQIVASDQGKTLHVLYHKYQKEIEDAKALLGDGFEAKPLEEDVV